MSQETTVQMNMDAFSDGQMASKLWLCKTLEDLFLEPNRFENVWVYGSWYGTLPFMLMVRERFRFKTFSLLDLDPTAIEVSRKVLDHWKFAGGPQIRFYNHDCSHPKEDLPKPQLVINTSSEHFASFQWWETVPTGTVYAVQSTDLLHEEHICRVENVDELAKRLKLSKEPLYKDKRHFEYSSLIFNRYMVIGEK